MIGPRIDSTLWSKANKFKARLQQLNKIYKMDSTQLNTLKMDFTLIKKNYF